MSNSSRETFALIEFAFPLSLGSLSAHPGITGMINGRDERENERGCAEAGGPEDLAGEEVLEAWECEGECLLRRASLKSGQEYV